MNSQKQIKFGAVISYAAVFINIIATLIYTPWMVAQIGQSNYGLYTLATSLISLLLVDFGISSATSRFLSKYRAEGKQKEIEQLLGATYKLFLGLDLLLLIAVSIVYIFMGDIYAKLNPSELQTFKILFIIVAGFNLISFPTMPLNGILTSYEKFIQLKVCDLFRKLFTIALVVVALLFNMGVVAVVLANAVAGTITILIKLIIIKAQIGVKASFRSSGKGIYRMIFGFSIWITLISFAQKFIYNMASSVLGIVSGSIAIAIFAPASSIGSYYYTFAEAINGLFLPTISRKIASNREDEITPLMIKVGRFQMFVLGWLFVGFICVGKEFMVLWMGPDYVMSYYCTILVLFPALLEYSQQIGKTTIIAKNLVKWQAIGFCIIGVVTLGLSFLLGYFLGALGVCVSICIAGCANVVWQSYIFSHKLNIDMKAFYKKCYLPAFLPIAASVVLGIFLLSLISHTGWLYLVIKAIIVSAIYLLLFFLFGTSRDGKRQILEKLKLHRS